MGIPTKPIFVRFTDKTPGKNWRAVFICYCGKEWETFYRSVFYGQTKSCGCWKIKVAKEQARKMGKKYGYLSRKHGEANQLTTRTPEYRAWSSMKGRCSNKNNQRFHRYGGRGIRVCERWANPKDGYLNFISDVGRRPSKKHSLDRINNNGDYEPGNCRWATSLEQAENKEICGRGKIRLLDYDGLKMPLKRWAKFLNIPHETFRHRINNGVSIFDASLGACVPLSPNRIPSRSN